MAEIGEDIQHAKSLLQSGQLVAIPTETVYGLAANALNEEAVLKIFEAKQRPKFDPLIVHIKNIDSITPFISHFPEQLKKLADRFWPGPLTLLLPKSSLIPDLVTSGLPNVAIRIPNHPITQSLLNLLDFPLAAPSANPFGYVSPTTAQHVEDQLGEKVPYILQGDSSSVGLESTIVGLENEQIVVFRKGGLSIEQIEEVVGKVLLKEHSESNPKAPGMLSSHYAPAKQIVLGNINELIKKYRDLRLGIISFKDQYEVHRGRNIVLSKAGSVSEAAKNLFSAIRQLDNEEIDLIVAEKVPDLGLGPAINDRLTRASFNKI